MRSIFLMTLFTLAASTASAATIKAGADSSGGGKSVVCRNSAGKIRSVEMLDLYEARAMYSLRPADLGTKFDVILDSVINKLYPISAASWVIGEQANLLRSRLRILPPGTKIQPVDDASPVALPAGCKLEQAAVWVDSSLVVADRELWTAMNERNRAALIMHEVIYDYTRRREGEKNSRRARKIVAHLFSQYDFGDINAGIPNQYFFCYDLGGNIRNATAFKAYPDEAGILRVTFEQFNGRTLFGKSVASFNVMKYLEDSPTEKWDNSRIESTFDIEENFSLKWDPAKPSGAQYFLPIVDEDGRIIQLPITCIFEDTKP